MQTPAHNHRHIYKWLMCEVECFKRPGQRQRKTEWKKKKKQMMMFMMVMPQIINIFHLLGFILASIVRKSAVQPSHKYSTKWTFEATTLIYWPILTNSMEIFVWKWVHLFNVITGIWMICLLPQKIHTNTHIYSSFTFILITMQ